VKKRLEVTSGGLLPLIIGIVIVSGAGACGKRGNPLPPLRPVPAAVTALTARRIGDRVEIRFTIPSDNLDRSSPPSVRRVDVYAAVGPTSASPPVPAVIPPVVISIAIPSVPLSFAQFPAVALGLPPAGRRAGRSAPAQGPPVTAAAILQKKYLRGHLDVRPPPPPVPPPPKSKESNGKEPASKAPAPPPTPPPPRPPDPRPGAGDTVSYVDQVTTEIAAAQQARDPMSIRYVVMPVAGSDRNGVRSLVEVPLRADPIPPINFVAGYNESILRITWAPTAPAQNYQVYRSDPAGKETGPPVNPTPLTVPEIALPVEFGVERCYIVRTAVVMGTATVESAPVGPACTTAVDTFPPAPPANLSLLPTEGKITVQWDAVPAADLAGYVVLRAEGGSTTFQPLMQTPIADTNYTDATTKVGTRYTYGVIAVDKAGNRSAPSNTADGVGR
jgi:hypothetical protein